MAPGFRDSGYGELGVLHDVGHDGYSWSSATGGIHGLDLTFRAQYLYYSTAHTRGHGFQLRCLSE
ncbi:hypothetical protein [uncultured Rikenella sp.]|uniref:hypothetical protein n=1 Tax=uncultured Rikenella sp. TaxID=368003 RepID=UPI00272BB356|nr:hypothetical protein [uncultured Rikenella sp.]